jgi:hypothetical protein
VNVMKEVAAAQPDKRTRAIVLEAQANMAEASAALMPSYNACRQRILKKRVDKYSELIRLFGKRWRSSTS